MKLRKEILAIVGLLLTGSLTLFAAGQGEKSSTAQAPIEFNLMRFAQKDITPADIAKDRIKNYIEKKFNVKLNLVIRAYQSHKVTHQNLIAEMAAGNAPDYNWAFVGVHLPVATWQKWIHDGLVVDIGKIVKNNPKRYPVLYKMIQDPYWKLFNYKYNGDPDATYAIWDVVVQKAARGGILYNGSLLRGVGREKPPATYKDFIQTLRDVHKKYGVPGFGWVSYKGVWWGAIGWDFFEPQGKHIGCTPRDNAGQRYFQRENGEWYDAAIAPENKAVWKELQGYAREGLFNPTWLTEDWYAWTKDKWPADQIFCGDVNWTQDPNMFNAQYQTYKKAHPNAKVGVDVLLGDSPLKGPGGQTVVQQVSVGYWGLKFMPYTNKHPEKFLDLLEYSFTQEGADLMGYGIKGIHYTKDDKSDWNADEWAKDMGIYVKDPKKARQYARWDILDVSGGVDHYFYRNFERYGYFGALQKMVNLGAARTPKTEAMQYAAKIRDKLFAEGIYQEIPYYFTLVQFTEEQNTIDQRLADIRNSWWSKWLSNEADVDATWDKYVAEYKAAGADELLKAWTEGVEKAKKLFESLTGK